VVWVQPANKKIPKGGGAPQQKMGKKGAWTWATVQQQTGKVVSERKGESEKLIYHIIMGGGGKNILHAPRRTIRPTGKTLNE